VQDKFLTLTQLEEEILVDNGNDGLKLERACKHVLRGQKKNRILHLCHILFIWDGRFRIRTIKIRPNRM
jgi:hypothetical protein